MALTSLLPCWCGSTDWRLCFQRPRGGLARCTRCGCYQTDPPPLTKSDQLKDFYTEYYSEGPAEGEPIKDPSNSYSAGFWKVAAQVPNLRRVASRVVDIGSGDGHLCAELRAFGWPNVVGVEASATRAARARKFYPDIDFMNCYLSESDEPEHSFDMIVIESVIEHLPKPTTQLEELRRYIRPGGTLVVTTPNMDSGHFRLLGKQWTGMLAPHAHIFLFTAAALRTALQNAGFREISIGSFPLQPYSLAQLGRRFFSGDVKGAVWRAHQELGSIYGRLIHQEPMLYAVGTVN